MESIAHLKQRFLAMPWFLRILVAASTGIGLVFPLLPFVPGATFELGERQLNYQELWQTRVAFALFAVGPLMLGVGIAVFLRKRWVRPVLVVLPLLQVLPFWFVHWAFSAPRPVPSLALFAGQCVVWVVLTVVYLFGTRGAREHFANAGS